MMMACMRELFVAESERPGTPAVCSSSLSPPKLSPLLCSQAPLPPIPVSSILSDKSDTSSLGSSVRFSEWSDDIRWHLYFRCFCLFWELSVMLFNCLFPEIVQSWITVKLLSAWIESYFVVLPSFARKSAGLAEHFNIIKEPRVYSVEAPWYN